MMGTLVGKKLNNIIVEYVHEAYVRLIIYGDKISSYEELLEKDR